MLKQSLRNQVKLIAGIRAAREACGLSLAQASARLGSKTLMQKIESGERQVKAAELPTIAKALETDPVELYRKML